jgi:hypothetical protein
MPDQVIGLYLRLLKRTTQTPNHCLEVVALRYSRLGIVYSTRSNFVQLELTSSLAHSPIYRLLYGRHYAVEALRSYKLI